MQGQGLQKPLTQSKLLISIRQGWVLVRFIKLDLDFIVIIKEHTFLYTNAFVYKKLVIVQRQI